jgi:biopolymer transport protein ExbD
MAHGLSTDALKAEPNLVPLLDLVFQLIMFFMICVNFVSEQVNKDIQLPVSQSARAMDKGEVDVLFLNMDRDGNLMISGQPRPLNTHGEIQYYLRQQYSDAERTAKEAGDKTGKVKTAVIIRADENATYAQVYDLMQACKTAGFRKLQLRVRTKARGVA